MEEFTIYSTDVYELELKMELAELVHIDIASIDNWLWHICDIIPVEDVEVIIQNTVDPCRVRTLIVELCSIPIEESI